MATASRAVDAPIPPVTLDHLLTLAGRLDDGGGFDAPRERFRRFLLDYTRQPDALGALIDQCQHAPGEQHHRALVDLVTLLGRPLGFEVTFGAYTRTDRPSSHPVWRSRAAEFALDVRTAQSAPAEHAIALPVSDDPHLSPFLPERADAPPVEDVRVARALVVLAPSANRPRIEDELRASGRPASAIVLTVDTLVRLAAIVSAGRLAHEDAVRLLVETPVDFVVDLLHRTARAADARSAPSAVSSPGAETTISSASAIATPDAAAGTAPARWLITIGRDEGLSPDQFLRVVVGRRSVLGLQDDGTVSALRARDRVGFHIGGVGVVGRAEIEAIDSAAVGLRDAGRFRHVLKLRDVVLTLDAPVPLDAETTLRVRSAPPGSRHAHTVVRISAERFAALTAPRGSAPPDADGARTAELSPAAVPLPASRPEATEGSP